MARAAVKAKQQARAKAQPAKQQAARTRGGRKRHAGGGNPNQQLFFMRLRRRQKWVFLALAVVFAATFAGVGVGSGSGGLDQLYSGLFGGGGTSISKAKAEIAKNPAKGYRDLARAYETKGDTVNAISALQSYVGVKKNDAGAWSELGGLQLSQGQAYAAQYQQAQQNASAADPGAAFQPTGQLANLFGTNPAQQAATSAATSQLTTLSQQMSSAYSGAMTSYQSAAKIQPHNAQAQFELANAANLAGQYATELQALKAYVRLAPHSPYTKRFKHIIKQLNKTYAPAKPKHK